MKLWVGSQHTQHVTVVLFVVTHPRLTSAMLLATQIPAYFLEADHNHLVPTPT
jgi:hypothetical protein